jgi:hypothetical protein
MKGPPGISESNAKRLIRLVAVLVTLLAIFVPGSGQGLAQEIQSVTVFVHGLEVASDIPPIVMSERVFLPDQFVAGILGYPFKWEPKTRSVRVGVPPAGLDMVRELPPFTGKAPGRAVKVQAVSYPLAYAVNEKNSVRWSLQGVIDSVTFNFGMPDGHRGKSVGFKLLLDGNTLAEGIVNRDEGLKEYTFDVSGAKVLTVKYNDQPGGVLVNPRGYQT